MNEPGTSETARRADPPFTGSPAEARTHAEAAAEPVIDLSFLDTDWWPADGEDDGYKPLTPEQVAALLDEAARSAHDHNRTGRIHIRLTEDMQAADRVCPVDQRSAALSRLYVDHYREGASPPSWPRCAA